SHATNAIVSWVAPPSRSIIYQLPLLRCSDVLTKPANLPIERLKRQPRLRLELCFGRNRLGDQWPKRWQKSTTASTKALAAGDSDRLLSSQTQNTSGSFINSFTGTMETVPALTSLSTANRGSKAHLRSKLTSALTRVIELVTQNTFGLIAWRLNVRSICCRTPEDLSVRTKGNSASSCNDMALRPASGGVGATAATILSRKTSVRTNVSRAGGLRMRPVWAVPLVTASIVLSALLTVTLNKTFGYRMWN